MPPDSPTPPPPPPHDSIVNLTRNWSMSASRGEFSEGDGARIHGLQSREDLNGQHVELQSWFPPHGRWAVKVTSSGEHVRIKPTNLERVADAADPSVVAGTASASGSDDAGAPASASKKKREKAKAAAARKKAAAAAAVAEEESLGPEPADLEWQMHSLTPAQLTDGVAACQAAARRCVDKRGTWYLYVRKSACWLGDDEEKRRLWFVTLLRHPNLADCYLFDGPRLDDLYAKLGVPAAAACVAALIAELGVCPARVACAPLGHAGGHRVRSASLLAHALSEALEGTGVAACAVECSELPEERLSSVVGLALPPRLEPGLGGARARMQPRWLCFMSLLEHRLEFMERGINQQNGVSMSSRLGGMFGRASGVNVYDNRTASVAALRELFSACAAFHDAAPWHVLSNDEYLHLRSAPTGPDVGGDGGGPTVEAWAMVCGHNDAQGRGLNVYWSLADLRVSLPDPTAATAGWMDRLQYQAPDMVPFSTLDAVGELGLEIATSEREVWGGEVLPLWYRRRRHQEGDVDGIVRAWSQPPPIDVWPHLAAILRATARFAASPMAQRPDGRHAPLTLATHTVTLEGMEVTAHSADRRCRESFW